MIVPATQPKVRVFTLKIDDRDVSAREDETILDVARQHGISIPSLCYLVHAPSLERRGIAVEDHLSGIQEVQNTDLAGILWDQEFPATRILFF